MNITEPLRRHALERPGAPAIVRPDGAIFRWRDVDRLVDHLARRCLDEGIVPGDVVTLAIRRPLRLLLLQLALARLGAAGASPAIGADTASACLADDLADARQHRAFVVDKGWFALGGSVAVAPVPSWPDGNAVAIVCPSSGTTGVPKAIPVTHAQLAVRVAAANSGVPLPSVPCQICLPGASSGFGFLSILRVLGAGGVHVVASTPEEIVSAVPRYSVNRLVLMPFWIERIAAALPPDRSLATLAQVEVGGAFTPGPLLRLARDRLCRDVYSVYGATEVGCIAMGAFDGLDGERGEVGRVLEGIEVAAFDATGNVLPPGAEGVLRVRGAASSGRYLGDANATAEAFVDGWLVTPDVGRVGPDGTIALAGRLGDLISVGGYRVRPGEIEDAMLSIKAIDDAAAFGATDARGVTQLCAAFVSRSPIHPATLAGELRARIPGMQPTIVFRVAQVPRNAGGKVERKALVSMALACGALT